MKRCLICIIVVCLLTIVGCGGPKPDVSIFMMVNGGLQSGSYDKFQQALQTKVGEKPTVHVDVSPIFFQQKLIVELAVREYAIMILPKDSFQMVTLQGGAVSLDDTLKASEYPLGVVEAPKDYTKPDGPKEKHLYGIPISQTHWLKDMNYLGDELYAFVMINASNADQAKQVLKVLAEK
ncbi:MAG: hypothetical protein JWM44_3418 [Bacilli bacterium]|nr:hypothetical protein [Bacilli bacterium]